MIKAIIKWVKNLWEKEVDYTFEIEFGLYDLLLLMGIVFLIWWWI